MNCKTVMIRLLKYNRYFQILRITIHMTEYCQRHESLAFPPFSYNTLLIILFTFEYINNVNILYTYARSASFLLTNFWNSSAGIISRWAFVHLGVIRVYFFIDVKNYQSLTQQISLVLAVTQEMLANLHYLQKYQMNNFKLPNLIILSRPPESLPRIRFEPSAYWYNY